MPALGLFWIVLTLLAPTPVPQGMPGAAGSNEQSASEAHAILDGAQRAAGVWPTPGGFQLLTAAAVEGPTGSFRTTIYSSSDGRVRMEQPHSGFLAGVGRSGGWMVDPDSGDVGELGPMESFVRGHEIHMLALLPRSRASDPRFLGPHRFGGGDALAVALTLATGDSVVVYFQPADTLPIGLRVPWVEPHGLTHWTDWMEVEGVRLFRRATFRQGPEEFRYTFDRLETGPFSDALFEAPSSRGGPRADVEAPLPERAPSEETEVRRVHAELLRAHRDGNVDLWMSLESEHYVSVNGGRVSFPSTETRRAQRAPYLADAEFTVYRDLREPVVRISEDGSLGWLIAEVEIEGTATGPEGERVPFRDVWAWVELYERTETGWRMTGNASNRRR